MAVPSQQGTGPDNRRARPAAQPVGPYGESPPEKAILFDQISERITLPAIEPAGDGEE
jgi:hypothetical protein